MDTEIKEYVSELRSKFQFDIELEPQDERVMYLNFHDGRKYRLQHPGALAATRLFNKDQYDESLDVECLEMFLTCIQPVANTNTKKLTNETMDIDEAFDLWAPFAWRWLRRSYKIVAV